tara:strand:+ start:1497 stop:1694 length:198 start_codon:yes stop_codon:yes gene_type:complete
VQVKKLNKLKIIFRSTKTTSKCSICDIKLAGISHIQIIEYCTRLAVLARYEFPRTCGIAVAEFLG